MARKITVKNSLLIGEVIRAISEGKSVWLKAKGNSMRPFIQNNNNVELEAQNHYEVNDIVLAEVAPKVYVIHRIYKIEGSKITLMGDGNILGVERCSPEKIVAKVIKIEHKKGKQTNPDKQKFRAKIWRKLLPLRRYILFLFRILHI